MATKLFPLGARVFVQLIAPELDLEKRATEAGIKLILEEHTVPKPTTGLVVAVGTDPFLREQVSVGDTVFFGPYAGHDVSVQGESYRSLELSELTAVERTLSDEPPSVSSPSNAS